jgi:hypothetical protein
MSPANNSRDHDRDLSSRDHLCLCLGLGLCSSPRYGPLQT